MIVDKIDLYEDMIKKSTPEDLFGDLDFVNKPMDKAIAKAILMPNIRKANKRDGSLDLAMDDLI